MPSAIRLRANDRPRRAHPAVPSPPAAPPAAPLAFVLVCLLVPLAWASPASAATAHAPATYATPSADEQAFFDLVNQARMDHGLGALQFDPGLSTVARDWSATMAGTGVLAHDPDLVATIDAAVGPDWTYLGGNVGVGSDVAGLHAAFMASPAHTEIVFGPYNRVGVGVTRNGPTLWVSFVLLGGPPLA